MVFFVKWKLCWVIHQRNSVLASNYFQVEWLHRNDDYKRSLEQVLENHVIKPPKIFEYFNFYMWQGLMKIVSLKSCVFTHFGMSGEHVSDEVAWKQSLRDVRKDTVRVGVRLEALPIHNNGINTYISIALNLSFWRYYQLSIQPIQKFLIRIQFIRMNPEKVLEDI